MKVESKGIFFKIVVLGIVFVLAIIIIRGIINNSRANNESNEKIVVNSVENFYKALNSETMSVMDLPKDYTVYDAIDDGCFRVFNKTYNEQAYKEFMEAYNNKEKAFIRVAQTTDEGDLVLFDVAYFPDNKKVYIVKDDTRDKLAVEQDRTYSLKEFDRVGKYRKGDNTYFVAYNGETINMNASDTLVLMKLK